jgi:hypothetical protein
MIRRILMCLTLAAPLAAAQENPALEAAMASSLKQARAQSSQTVSVNKCWTRTPRVDAIMDSAKLPVDFCLRTITVSIAGDGGQMISAGAYTPAGAAERAPLTREPKAMSSYRMSVGGRKYSAYVFSGSNAHGDTGDVWVSVDADADGKVVPGSVTADFGVGCPQEECAEGEEPGVRVFVSDWR